MRIVTTLLATAAFAAIQAPGPLAAQEARNAAATTTAEATDGIGGGADAGELNAVDLKKKLAGQSVSARPVIATFEEGY